MNGLKLKHIIMLIIILLVGALPGCYCNARVAESQVGLVMPDGVRVSDVVGPGRYTNLNYFADIETMDASAKTLVWEDPDLVTADKQPIGLTLGITYARKRDADSVSEMWRQYRSEAVSDEALAQQVHNRMARVAKAVTAKYTLDEMLGVAGSEATGRQVVAQDLFKLLEPELAEVKVVLLDVGVNNIVPSTEYLRLLEQKANAQVAVEVAKEETKRLNEQLEQEKAQTQIEVEKAKRQNQVNEELSKVYEQSPQYYELERLRLLKDVIGDSDKIYFIPEDGDLTLILGGGAPVIPASQ
jgi:hypothetical protein